MNDVTSWTTAITQNLAAALIWMLLARFASAKAESIHRVKGVAIRAGKRMWPVIARMAADALVFMFLVTQLRWLVQDPTPLTREDALAIAFWTWWLMWYVLEALLKPLAQWRRAAAAQQRRPE